MMTGRAAIDLLDEIDGRVEAAAPVIPRWAAMLGCCRQQCAKRSEWLVVASDLQKTLAVASLAYLAMSYARVA